MEKQNKTEQIYFMAIKVTSMMWIMLPEFSFVARLL